MQTILGAGGVIANELANQLPQYTNRIRLVNRTPIKVNSTDETLSADLRNYDQVLTAVTGSEIVYLTAGVTYTTQAWQQDWPQIMSNVIKACQKSNAKLVYFDNVYAYGNVDGWMREDTPMNPTSRKGEVKAAIANHLLAEIQKGSLTALIARSADFYGPAANRSFILPMVFEKLSKNKTANWLVNENVKHSLTYTKDAGRATALLGNTNDAFNQTWHLPTNHQALTGRQFIEAVAKAYGVKPKLSTMSKWMVKFGGLFDVMAKESYELLYQFDHDYLFDSTKFSNAFFSPTDTNIAIQTTLESMLPSEMLLSSQVE